ncbi:ABC transporter substrate-binding protein [Bailinhaonella thermotolerans]|uniref:Extracellular solute-binding protein n=1 Tax=Bailinhaonella thermotolerans TaxID=1070861 RepID=A0A3A4B8J5_9ACTN|nr:extracellular solute-binding protein [Bailinhaonella thermotolerans]RJL34014.1 extracellular solute-binding protein [Bailinhaonella thermotolerans]
MRTWQSRAAAVLTIGALALGVTGCGKKNSDSATGEKARESLVYRSTWGEAEPQAKIFKAALDDFAARTGAKVEVTFVGRKGGESMPTEMAAGRGPDLFDAATDNLATWQAQNLLTPLDDVLAAQVPGEGKTVADVLPAAVKTASSTDKGLGLVPHTIISTAVWFDAARHPELASAPPKTWEEFIAYLDKAKKAGRVPIGQDGTVNFYNVYWFYSALVRANGAGSLKALSADPAAWDRPEVLEAARKVAQLAKGGYFQKDFMATKFPAAQDAWAAGEYDLNLNGTWLASETKPKLGSGAKVASFQLPVGGKDSVEVGTLGWGVNAKGKNKETAKKFLAFFLQSKYVSQIATAADNIPSRADVPAPAHLAGVQKDVASATATHRTYDEAAADKSWWNDVFLPLHDQLISGKIDAAAFVAQGKKKAADHIASRKS